MIWIPDTNHILRRRRGALLFILYLTASIFAHAQTESPSSLVLGEIRSDEVPAQTDLTVEARKSAGGDELGGMPVHADGTFELHGVEPGTYLFSVRDRTGRTLWQDFVQVAPGISSVTIDLHTSSPRPTTAGTVSVTEMKQKLSRASLHEVKLAERASHAGNRTDVVAHLKRAVELSPSAPSLRNDLGASYLRLGDYDSARRELEQATALDPEWPVPHANLALALLYLGQSSPAEQQANLALRRAPLSAPANYAAGMALMAQGKWDEALALLDRASAGIPRALFTQAQILAKHSRKEEAIAKLRAYLSHPGLADRAEAAQWLEALLKPAPNER